MRKSKDADRSKTVVAFEQRWAEAKASGCTSVLIKEDKWMAVDLLVEEALRSQSLRRELIEVRVQTMQWENKNRNGGSANQKPDCRATSRAS